MVVVQHNNLVFEIKDFRPKVTPEMSEWFLDNGIRYKTKENKYGPGGFHYLFYIWLETEEDAVAFKLRWV